MTFAHPMELAVLQTRLESEDIECRILDELIVQVNPFFSNAIGGVKLQVKESDIPRAIEILKVGGYIKDDNAQPSKNKMKFANATSMECPNCGSGEILKNKISKKAFAISILFLGFPLPFISKTYHCFDCGQNFKKIKQ